MPCLSTPTLQEQQYHIFGIRGCSKSWISHLLSFTLVSKLITSLNESSLPLREYMLSIQLKGCYRLHGQASLPEYMSIIRSVHETLVTLEGKLIIWVKSSSHISLGLCLL